MSGGYLRNFENFIINDNKKYDYRLMKMKITFIFLFSFILSLTIKAQDFSIVGPPEMCVGDCANYYLIDAAGNTVTGGIGWGGLGPGGMIIFQSSVLICSDDESPHYIYVVDDNVVDTLAEMEIQVISSFQPQIITQSGAYCPADSIGGGSCDQVCANTTITYTTVTAYPTQDVIWTVNGAEDYNINGNNVTVTWGEPGNGHVSLQVSPPGDIGFSISCGMYQPATNGDDGGGFVYIDGPPDTYSIELSNGTTVSGFGINMFDGLAPGTYTAWVTDINGIVEVCGFTIEDLSTNCTFGVALDNENASDCQSCDASMTGVVIGGTGPFSYEWIEQNGSVIANTPTIQLCPTEEIFFLVVTDLENGCSVTASGVAGCNTTTCWGFNSICVDILENPDAAFTTNPPATNGVVEICEGQTVFFENLTTGGSKFTWDFGNSTSSSEVDAEYTYLTSGTYEVLLIARNDCYCSDTTSITVVVEGAISPEIDCAGTICPDTEVTYSTTADCSSFNWNISSNGTIIAGGGISDNYIIIDWGTGPEGLIELVSRWLQWRLLFRTNV